MSAVAYLLTSYNKAEFLPMVLESIRREHADTGGQIIIIDDGSTDHSVEICRQFAEDNPNAIYIEQQNRGVYAAVNRIVPLARAPWIRLCDSDDPLVIGSTRYLVEMAEREDASIAYGKAYHYGPEPLPAEALDEAPTPSGEDAFVHADALLHLIEAMDFTTSRAIYRTEDAQKALPLPEHLISCQDFAIALRMTASGRLVRLSGTVCFYMYGASNQLSASRALTRHQTIRILQASQDMLNRRHRSAALTVSYKWQRRDLREVRRGISFQLGKIALKTRATAAKLGLYDWNQALDAFAAPYESQIAHVISRRTAPY
jgi:glycosyltransferase involved in cell wall biosynthesis